MGMMVPELCMEAAGLLEGSERVLAGIADVESGMRTADMNGGVLVQRFEPAVFEGFYPNVPVPSGGDDGSYEYFRCTSWGVGQIMGMHWQMLGWQKWSSMKSWLLEEPVHEWNCMVDFIMATNGLADAVRTCDWNAIGRLYNGDDTGHYGSLVEQVYETLELPQ